MRRPQWVGLACGVVSLLATANAHALFFERHLVCKRDEGSTEPVATKAPAKPKLEPLPRRKPPPLLDVAPLFVADVSVQDPIPRGHRERPDPEERVVIMREAANDYRCLGLPRGKAGILRVLSAPPGAKFARHPHPESWIEENADAAAAFDLRETIAPLRRTLGRKIPSSLEPWQVFARERLKTAAARALADLGDAASVADVKALALDRESSQIFGAYRDALDALSRLDGVAAHDYAVEALARVATSRLETGDTNRLVDLLPLVGREDPKARTALEAISRRLDPKGEGGGFQSCRVYAARIRAGDIALRDAFRKELAVDLVTSRSVNCYSEVIEAAFPGRDAVEVPTLLYRHRYDALLAFVRRSTIPPSTDPAVSAALASIRGWLEKRKADPDVALDRSDRRFEPETRALHLALAAKLGDQASEKALLALIDDERDDGTAPWVASRAALDLEIAGAADHAVKRLLIARTQHMERHKRDSWPLRGRVHVTEHVEVIDRLADRGDARFVLGLLDRDAFTREATVHLLARRRPASACQLVADNAGKAEERAVQDAFWALSIMGEACQKSFLSRATAASEPAALRGMALESLAMLREATVAGILKKKEQGALRPAAERAAIILHSPE